MRRLTALFVIAACLGLLSPAAAEPVFPLGLQVGLEPAGDLTIGKGRPGFEDVDRKVIAAIAQLPAAAFENVQQALFGRDPTGATEVKREVFPFHDGIGYLHSARIVENGVGIRRWLLLATPPPGLGQGFIAVVNVNVPDAAADIYSDAVVRRMLASVTFRKPPVEEQLGLLPFSLGDRGGFRVTQVQLPGAVILTDGPSDGMLRQPYIVVSVGQATPEQLEDRTRFSREFLSTVPLRDIAIQLADEMRIGGRPGFEIRADAKTLNGEPVKFVQWLRFNVSTFVRVLGVAPPDRWDELFTRFRAVRDGVELR